MLCENKRYVMFKVDVKDIKAILWLAIIVVFFCNSDAIGRGFLTLMMAAAYF